MRVTRDRLLSLALEETERRATKRDVLSGYVIGSLAAGDPLLGGSGDIDLVLIHESKPLVERELVPLSGEIHFDITHRPRSFYREPRKFRSHPWYGPEMCEPVFLYDPTHYFEWAQAAVRGQFHRVDFAYARSQAFLARARRYSAEAHSDGSWLRSYLRALLETVNSVASLTGFPAAGRQVAAQLASKLSEIGHPELFERFQHMLGADQLQHRALPEWIAAWARAYDRALSEPAAQPHSGVPGEPAGARPPTGELLTPERRTYYLAGFQSMLEDGRGSLILWPLLASWAGLPQLNGRVQVRQSMLEQLLLAEQHANRRIWELEQMQDQVEGQLERWSERMGA